MALLHGTWIHSSLTQKDPQSLSNCEPSPDSLFLIWGETWRSSTTAIAPFSPAPLHPFSLSSEELSVYLQTLHQSRTISLPSQNLTQWQERSLGLLCRWTEKEILPLHSGVIPDPTDDVCLYPVRVGGFCLSAAIATEFLLSIPLGADLQTEDPLGADLHYWKIGRAHV